MRDPHVQTLEYQVQPAEGVRFGDAPPVEWETPEFRARLVGASLTVSMLRHYATEAEARRAVDPYAKAWEVTASLDLGRPAFGLDFRRAAVIDRAPPADAGVRSPATGSLSVAATVAPVQTYPAYPEPPTVFAITPDVESMWGRWTGYMNDREPLASMASMCLTILEAGAGGRPDARRTSAAAKYGVTRDVLELLGDLTSDLGEAQTGRGAHVSRRSPHTHAEVGWIEAVVPLLIRRAGEVAYDPGRRWPQISLADFPQL
jgi:hypothetical protein